MHLGSRTFESISSAIVFGELAAGETLSDRTLGVSRTAVPGGHVDPRQPRYPRGQGDR